MRYCYGRSFNYTGAGSNSSICFVKLFFQCTGIHLSFCATRDNGLQGKPLALLVLETNMPVPAQLECLRGWMHCLIYELNSI